MEIVGNNKHKEMKTVSKVETLKMQAFENDRCLRVNAKSENKFLLNRYLSTYVKLHSQLELLSLFKSNKTVFSKCFICAICHFF